MIVLNGRAAAREQISGVERVARQITSGLLAAAPDIYELLRPPPGAGRALGQAWEQSLLPARAARRGAALIYSPANLAPLAWPRNVVVLHDAAVWRHRDSYSAAYGAWHRRLEGAVARRAVAVVTVSEFSRRALVDVLGLDPGRVMVVPNGVDARFAAGADPEPARRRYGLKRPYVLTVGTADARKNLGLLGRLSERLAADGVDVAWAGGRRGHLPGGGSERGVRSLGYVPEDLLPGLYAGAVAFVLPSRYEGFGLPCLEAMASGTPVVAADRAALPETCGQAAVLADPDDEERFIAAVSELVGDEDRRSRLREAGLARAAELSWAAAVARTDELLRGLAAQR